MLHDGLTGAHLRGPGMAELEREVARATRTSEPLVMAFVDVDGLKAVNDLRGHAAGDRTLAAVADALRANLRGHDLLVRYGGDEFVCVMSGLSLADAARRLERVHAALAGAPEPTSMTVGLVQREGGESANDVLARADADLYRRRQQSRRSS